MSKVRSDGSDRDGNSANLAELQTGFIYDQRAPKARLSDRLIMAICWVILAAPIALSLLQLAQMFRPGLTASLFGAPQ